MTIDQELKVRVQSPQSLVVIFFDKEGSRGAHFRLQQHFKIVRKEQRDQTKDSFLVNPVGRII